MRILSALSAIAALSASAFAQAAQVQAIPSRMAERHVPTRRYYGTTFTYPSGPGWTVAHAKRMAQKRRNQINAKRRKS